MKNILTGTVIKAVGGVFTVMSGDKKYTCFSPKKFRYQDSDVLVGDKVQFEDLHKGKGVVTEILPRKNKLHRPEIANVDVCFLTLASEPSPDLYLADKVLINCFQEQIEPIILVNKCDLPNNALQLVQDNYGKIATILAISAMDDSVLKLKEYISGKVVCFAGQSAVGKTSILNALLPDLKGQVGGLSAKTGRGTHTTRHSSLHKVFDGFVVDTCGFSLCDLNGIRSDELRLYLDDFVTISHDCKFTSCTHTVEPDCAVKKAVEQGVLCKGRYDRYVEEYNELKDAEKHQY
ncbi:MAG: ribosome small subunit-dependent GTPase A [Clostridia bacterium]|nr:ribosome small subunit-dependent GTPase A [Clostridia bacterium]